jgi:hypothetical protein
MLLERLCVRAHSPFAVVDDPEVWDDRRRRKSPMAVGDQARQVARLLARSHEANVVDHRRFEPVGGEVHGLANVEVVAAFTQVVLDPCRRLGHLRRPSGLEGNG